MLDLYIESENVRIEREKREAAQRKAEEEKRQKELRRQRWDAEIDKLQALENEAADYERACKIRAYIAAVNAKPEMTEDEKSWILWANAKADCWIQRLQQMIQFSVLVIIAKMKIPKRQKRAVITGGK